MAELLDREGYEVTARLPSQRPGQTTPDAFLHHLNPRTPQGDVEFTRLDPGGTHTRVLHALNRKARRAQSRQLLVDLRNTGLTQADVERGFARFQGQTHGAPQRLDRIRTVGDGFDLEYIRARGPQLDNYRSRSEQLQRSEADLRQRMAEVERTPPQYLRRDLGNPPRKPEERQAWREAARPIEDYRLRYGVKDDKHALGPVVSRSNVERHEARVRADEARQRYRGPDSGKT